MAKYDVTSISDKEGNEFSFRDGIHEVTALPAVASATKGVVYKLSTDSKFYMISDDATKWIAISYPADSTLSTTSTNPIQNKAVTEALNGKQASLSFLTVADVDTIWDAN